MRRAVLKRALRAAIRSSRLATGATLPPSRALAADLGCSRWAVTEAYAQLTAEGYLEARTGSGTRGSAMVHDAEARGVHVVDLAAYRISAAGPPALVLGYGNITDALVPAAVAVLADVLAAQI